MTSMTVKEEMGRMSEKAAIEFLVSLIAPFVAAHGMGPNKMDKFGLGPVVSTMILLLRMDSETIPYH